MRKLLVFSGRSGNPKIKGRIEACDVTEQFVGQAGGFDLVTNRIVPLEKIDVPFRAEPLNALLYAIAIDFVLPFLAFPRLVQSKVDLR
jgi:hypothetical protein